MPRLSSLFARISLIYLAAGFTLGALLLANKGLVFLPSIWKLLPIHIEVLLMGWFVQLAIGVAYWILPRIPGESPRGSVKLVWASFWLLNLGIGLVILEAIFSLPELVLAGRLVELAGVLAFVGASWKRVKAFGR
jgi:cbb3-type cytochrome oxidase subunit 1